MKVKFHVSLTFALDVMMILLFFLCKVLMIFQKNPFDYRLLGRLVLCVCCVMFEVSVDHRHHPTTGMS